MKRTKMKTLSSILLLIFLFLVTGCTGTVPTNNASMINSIPVTNSLVGALYTYNVEAADIGRHFNLQPYFQPYRNDY